MAKGTKSCCCSGCESILTDGNLPTAALQPMQQFCCRCAPKQLCVNVAFDTGAEDASVFSLVCHAEEQFGKTDVVVYTGTLGINGTRADAELLIRVDGGVCYFCLSAPDLGLVPSGNDDCLQIDHSQAQDGYDPDCTMATQFCCDWSATWEADVYGLGDGENATATITTSKADIKVLRGKTNCCRCDCVCRCICFTTIQQSVPDGQLVKEVVCGEIVDNDFVWENSAGYIIRLTAGYSSADNCRLELEIPYSVEVVPGFEPDPVEIDGDSVSCPRPAARFEFVSLIDGQQVPHEVIMACHNCGDHCDGEIPACCDTALPRVLVGTIDLNECPGDCGDYELAFVLAATGSIWEARNSKAFCGGAHNYDLACGGAECENFILTDAGGSQCGLDSATIISCDCEPFQIVFAVTMTLLGCCGQGAGSVTGTLTITE